MRANTSFTELAFRFSASLIIVLCGCTSAPGTQSPVALASAAKCKDQLASFWFPGALGATSTVSDPGVALITLSTITSLGGNVLGYDLCKDMTNLSLAPATTVRDGIYSPADNEFSVRLPAQLAIESQPGIQIWQRTKGWWENAFFVPTQSGSAIYGVSLGRKLSPDEAAMSDDQYADYLIGSNARLEFDITGGVSVIRLYRENVLVGGGLPAVMEVFGAKENSSHSANPDTQSSQDRPIYLIYYISKTKGEVAVLSILWRDECSSCAAGPDSEIRKMAPSIGSFVDSFKFNST